MPVRLAISDAVIGWLPVSAARILAWFWPRGAVARLAALGRVAARDRPAARDRLGARCRGARSDGSAAGTGSLLKDDTIARSRSFSASLRRPSSSSIRWLWVT